MKLNRSSEHCEVLTYCAEHKLRAVVPGEGRPEHLAILRDLRIAEALVSALRSALTNPHRARVRPMEVDEGLARLAKARAAFGEAMFASPWGRAP